MVVVGAVVISVVDVVLVVVFVVVVVVVVVVRVVVVVEAVPRLVLLRGGHTVRWPHVQGWLQPSLTERGAVLVLLSFLWWLWRFLSSLSSSWR